MVENLHTWEKIPDSGFIRFLMVHKNIFQDYAKYTFIEFWGDTMGQFLMQKLKTEQIKMGTYIHCPYCTACIFLD